MSDHLTVVLLACAGSMLGTFLAIGCVVVSIRLWEAVDELRDFRKYRAAIEEVPLVDDLPRHPFADTSAGGFPSGPSVPPAPFE